MTVLCFAGRELSRVPRLENHKFTRISIGFVTTQETWTGRRSRSAAWRGVDEVEARKDVCMKDLHASRTNFRLRGDWAFPTISPT